jgi:putative spermidine/putrescine transport system substrate-binding protein
MFSIRERLQGGNDIMYKKAGSILSVLTLCGVILSACGTSATPANPEASKAPVTEAPKTMEKQLVVAGNGATVETLMN